MKIRIVKIRFSCSTKIHQHGWNTSLSEQVRKEGGWSTISTLFYFHTFMEKMLKGVVYHHVIPKNRYQKRRNRKRWSQPCHQSSNRLMPYHRLKIFKDSQATEATSTWSEETKPKKRTFPSKSGGRILQVTIEKPPLATNHSSFFDLIVQSKYISLSRNLRLFFAYKY